MKRCWCLLLNMRLLLFVFSKHFFAWSTPKILKLPNNGITKFCIPKIFIFGIRKIYCHFSILTCLAIKPLTFHARIYILIINVTLLFVTACQSLRWPKDLQLARAQYSCGIATFAIFRTFPQLFLFSRNFPQLLTFSATFSKFHNFLQLSKSASWDILR